MLICAALTQGKSRNANQKRNNRATGGSYNAISRNLCLASIADAPLATYSHMCSQKSEPTRTAVKKC